MLQKPAQANEKLQILSKKPTVKEIDTFRVSLG